MPYNDARTADEIKADGDEMSVQARYSGGAVPGALGGEVLSDSTGYSGGTYAQNREAQASGDGDDPEDYVNAGFLDPDWDQDLSLGRPSDPNEALAWDHEQADQRYMESIAENMNQGVAEAAQAYGIPTEALQEQTIAYLEHASQEALAMGATPEQVQQNFLERPEWFLRQAALEMGQQMNQNAITNTALPYLDTPASRAARR
jgi:hypothetical protein